MISPMVKMMRITLMLLAALFLARGPAAYAEQALAIHVHHGHAEDTRHPVHMPSGIYRGEKQCSKAGCALTSCSLQMTLLAIMPDHQPGDLQALRATFPFVDDTSLSPLRQAPPSPPPKSPRLVTRAA